MKNFQKTHKTINYIMLLLAIICAISSKMYWQNALICLIGILFNSGYQVKPSRRLFILAVLIGLGSVFYHGIGFSFLYGFLMMDYKYEYDEKFQANVNMIKHNWKIK